MELSVCWVGQDAVLNEQPPKLLSQTTLMVVAFRNADGARVESNEQYC